MDFVEQSEFESKSVFFDAQDFANIGMLRLFQLPSEILRQQLESKTIFAVMTSLTIRPKFHVVGGPFPKWNPPSVYCESSLEKEMNIRLDDLPSAANMRLNR